MPEEKEIIQNANQPIGKDNPPIIGLKQYEAGLQLLQQYITNITVKVKGNNVDITYHWKLPTPEMAKTLAEGIKQQYGET